MALPNISIPIVRIINNDLEAWIKLPVPEEGEKYTVDYLHDVLKHNQINYGIDEAQLKKIAEEQICEREVLVARGYPSVDGVDGYYEYCINLESEKKPKILPDGSVDYWSMYSVQSVRKDQVIAIYHPAVQGKDGMGVSGKTIPAKLAREQSALRGTGFVCSEDGLTYSSTMDGKIDVNDGKIRIQQIYEISGDMNLTVGKIDFAGDIVIHGGVESGVSIKASGSITIDGVVEACTLDAGKDIILRKGMVGGGKAYVKTKGNLFAKFVEYSTIEVAGDIEADVLLDCNVICMGKIALQGRSGKIIGGDVQAIQGIKTTYIGNDAEVKTNVTVGVGSDCAPRMALLKKKVDLTKEELDKVDQGLKKFEQMEKERGVSYKDDPRRVALLRTKIKNTATLAADEAEIRKLENMVTNSKGATVTVTREIFAGCCIFIKEQRLNVKNNAKGVEFYYLDGAIRTRPASD